MFYSVHDTILLAGGYNEEAARRFDSIGYKIQNILPLPIKCSNNKLFLTNNNDLICFGGNLKNCYILKNEKWKVQSTLNFKRYGGVFVKMPKGIFAFGGKIDPNSSEFLPNGSTVWIMGPKIPKINIQPQDGTLHAVPFIPENGHKISENELILVSNCGLMKFDVEFWIFTEFMKLDLSEANWFASVIFDGKMIITGGEKFINNGTQFARSFGTHIIDLKTKECRIVGQMKIAKSRHAMEVISINNELKVITFGGTAKFTDYPHYKNLKSIEVFDEDTETWTLMDIELKQARRNFGHVKMSSTALFS